MSFLKYIKYLNMPTLYFYLGVKNANEVALGILKLFMVKKKCLNELENMGDLEIINFSDSAVRFNLKNVSGI